MPGIYGGFKKTEHGSVELQANNMLQRLKREQHLKSECRINNAEGFWLGRVHLGIINTDPQPAVYNNKSGLSDPAFLLQAYIKDGDACLTGLDGIYHCAVWDNRSKTLKLFSDKFGLLPLYYAALPDGVLFSAEVRGLLADPSISKAPDYESLADFLHYGQILGNKSLFRDIHLLPPGSILTFDTQRRSLEIKSYWRLLDLFPTTQANSSESMPDLAVTALIDSINARSGNGDLLGLSLSGGLDTRGILAGLGKHTRGLYTYTLGLPGCADQKIAEQLSRLAETNHSFIPITKERLIDFESLASTMINLSEGEYHPHESTEIVALEYLKDAPFQVLLRGHGGELAKASLAYPVMVRPEALSCRTPAEALDYVFRTTNLVLKDLDPHALFRASFRECVKNSPRATLDVSCGEASKLLRPADVCIYYYAIEHIRRQVVASLQIFRSQVELRMPYVEETFLRHLFRLPLKDRNAGEIHHKLISRQMPEAMKVVNSNTGAPLNAGPLRLFVTDKVSSVLKKLSISGFRHYTEFQSWHRSLFREGTQNLLLSERASSRGLFDRTEMQRVIDLHVSGQKDYGHFLGTMVGIELWFRTFVD
jgi:asparagine synthase (glutamine-hydrolysing)